MNSTQQRLAVVDRMYSGDLSDAYPGSLRLLDPEVPMSFLQVKLHTFSACLPGHGLRNAWISSHARIFAVPSRLPQCCWL